MKRLLFIWVLLLLPVLAADLDDLLPKLRAADFQVREQALTDLVEVVDNDYKGSIDRVLDLYMNPKTDPETRLRLLVVIEKVYQRHEFKEKNGFIGIRISPSAFVQDGELIRSVQIIGIEAGQQGEKAGLRERDQIAEINGVPFEANDTSTQFMKRIGYSSPGDDVKLKIYRDNEPLDIEVTLMARPKDIPMGLYDPRQDFKDEFSNWIKERSPAAP